jgi:alpha-beta hydrolase superfamily lysophospholipase
MSRLFDLTSAAARKSWRLGLKLTWLLILLALAIVLGFTLYAVSMLPPLQPWHTERLHEEFSALRHGNLDFAGYLQREEKLFAEMRATVATWDNKDETWLSSRFNPASMVSRLADGAPYNRSFRLTLPHPRGQALLIHGLTDSPYSMKALAGSLHSRGFEVTVLRLPGHGTLPSMMTEMSTLDWTAAARIAARDVASRASAGQPFYIGGYSTGGTLALQYALDALEDNSLRRPDRVLLVSPAIELTPVAALASIIDFLSVVPVPVLEKVRWQEIAPEYDPYKFNSFPVNASRQVNRATKALQKSLVRARESGRLARMPPVITWQSVVDSTVGSGGVADLLYARLNDGGHRLVLFDINRNRALTGVLRPQAGTMIDRLTRDTRGYELEVVGNTDPSGLDVNVHSLAPDGTMTIREPGLSWPGNVVSLGHVALPFIPDDPVYGFVKGSGHNGIPSIGSWLLRGESGTLTLSLSALTRLRSNPFWSLIDTDVAALVAADLSRQTPKP